MSMIIILVAGESAQMDQEVVVTFLALDILRYLKYVAHRRAVTVDLTERSRLPETPSHHGPPYPSAPNRHISSPA
jgi:hypothetical protein